MIENKDDMLLKLYSIEKNGQKILKEIESLFKNDKYKDLELYQKFKKIKEKYEN